MSCFLHQKMNILSFLVFILIVLSRRTKRLKRENTETFLKFSMGSFGYCNLFTAAVTTTLGHRAILVHSRESFSVSVHFKMTKSGRKPSYPSRTEAVDLLKKKQKRNLCESLNPIMTPTFNSNDQHNSENIRVCFLSQTYFPSKELFSIRRALQVTPPINAGSTDLPVTPMQKLLLFRASQILTLL